MAYIARSLTALLERTPADKAIVVFGARQTGKTTLLEHLFQDRKVKWLSGDEPQDRELLTSLSSKADISILLSGLDVLVIDEAQRIQGIDMLLKRLEDSKPSCRIFATGSSSLELAGGVMESAAGRLWPMTLFPLSVTELADHNSWLDVMESLPIRLTVGSYPEIVTHPQRSKATLRYLSRASFSKTCLPSPASAVQSSFCISLGFWRLTSATSALSAVWDNSAD